MVEIELKYAINGKDVAEDIWNDPYIMSLEEKDSRETVYMKSAYFDTADGILSENDIAFRVRTEGSRIIACLKWKGHVDGPLHTRNEINVPVDDTACLIKPDPSIFKESDMGTKLLSLTEGNELVSVMEVGFLRKRLRVDIGESIIEISIDIGEIVTDSGKQPICELELELFSGQKEHLLNLGEKISRQYGLAPENLSKYARGLMMNGKPVSKFAETLAPYRP